MINDPAHIFMQQLVASRNELVERAINRMALPLKGYSVEIMQDEPHTQYYCYGGHKAFKVELVQTIQDESFGVKWELTFL
jgi:hypothetical protein